MTRKLGKMPIEIASLDGIRAGFAYWLGIPTVLVRILFVVVTLVGSGTPILFYIICMFVMDDLDEVPDDYYEITSSGR